MRRDKAESKFATALATAIVDILMVNTLVRIQGCVVAIGNGKRALKVDWEDKN